ncbi:hypothetical protein [Auritidibacter ignavus]|uniref:hypothetical protein n=1 Tax=Auritidibacter ignavus TaxID=678932 RepID=UPI00109CF392|nr:hypothetical protein [Auritidibacter ignavus]
MQAVRFVSLVVMIIALVVAVFVVLNNVMDPSSLPDPIAPAIEALPEQGSGAAIVLTVVVVGVGILASVVHKNAKKALEKQDSKKDL